MTQEERRAWLIQALFDEDPYYQGYAVPADEAEQRDVLRSLMNVRAPKPSGAEFLTIQDEYLKEENARAGIVSLDDLTPTKADERIYLWQGDITRLSVGAIVNAANSGMCGCFQPLHNCIDNIIHTKAGVELRYKCHTIMRAQGHEEPTGQAKITPAYNLPCEYVIHTVGPIVQGSLTKRHEELLSSCYRSCLTLAKENGVTSLAFCCISTGVFMFPNERAAEIAVETVRQYYKETGSTLRVIFNVFKDIDLTLYQKLLQ